MAEGDGDRLWKQIQPWNWTYLEYAADIGCNLVPCSSVERSHEYPPLSFNTSVPTFRMPSGSSHMTYRTLPESSSSTALPFNPMSHGRFINQRMMHAEEYGFIDPMGYERGSYKRKWSSMPIDYDPIHAAGYFHMGSSYHNMHQMSISDSQQLHRDFEGITYNTQVTDSSRQCFQRNVRFRRSHAHHLDTDAVRNHFPTDLSSHLRSTGNLPCPSTGRQRNHGHGSLSYHGKAPFSDPEASTSEMNRFHYGSSSSNVLHAGDGIYHNSVQCRNFSPFAAHGPQSAGASSSTHNQRAISSWRPMPSFYLHSEVATAPSEVHEDISRRSMSISIGGSQHSSGRSGRIRESSGRLHSVPIATSTHGRWMPRGYTGIGRGIFYDSSITLDRHEDMRLDVDSMSYEELIALGERIGSVNTGLSEDAISMCLTRTIHCCPSVELEDDLDEKRCAICLENYEVGEEVGSLKCGHGYHFCCIRKWLEIKNSCPVCKASALEK